MEKNNFWNEAAKCGAVIGLVLAVSSVLENSIFFTSGTGFLYLMLLEFFAVAALHYYLLHRYTRRRSQLYTADEGFTFGQATGFCWPCRALRASSWASCRRCTCI